MVYILGDKKATSVFGGREIEGVFEEDINEKIVDYYTAVVVEH